MPLDILVYVLCYDDHTYNHAMNDFSHFDWAKVVVIPNENNVYLESIVYHKLLDEWSDEWKHRDFVGTLSWKAFSKMRKKVDLRSVIEAHADKDVVAFFGTTNKRESLLDQGRRSHPRFSQIWVDMLRSLGFEDSLATSKDIPKFFCNYWVTSPAWMQKYIDFSKRVKNALDANEHVWSDASYRTKFSKEQLLKLFGKEYFTHHAFVHERVPCFFFWVQQARIHVVPGMDTRDW
jgi:hypothetical protein